MFLKKKTEEGEDEKEVELCYSFFIYMYICIRIFFYSNTIVVCMSFALKRVISRSHLQLYSYIDTYLYNFSTFHFIVATC